MKRQMSKTKGRKYWTPEESSRLEQHVKTHGVGNWEISAKHIGKSASSCYQRWHNHLAPGVNGGEFTDEEKDKILGHFNLCGRKWSTIARHFPGRTANHIKNFVNTRLAKDARQAAAADSAGSAVVESNCSSAISSLPAGGGEAGFSEPNVVDYSGISQPLVGNNGGGADFAHVSQAEFSPPGGANFSKVLGLDYQQVNGAYCEYLSPAEFSAPDGGVSSNPNVSWVVSQQVNGADCVHLSQAEFSDPAGGVSGNPNVSWVVSQQVDGADCVHLSQAAFSSPNGGVLGNPNFSGFDNQQVDGADRVYYPAEFCLPGGGVFGNPNISGFDSQQVDGVDCVYPSPAEFSAPGGGVFGNHNVSGFDSHSVNGADCASLSRAELSAPGGGGGGNTEATSSKPNIDGEATGSVGYDSSGWW